MTHLAQRSLIRQAVSDKGMALRMLAAVRLAREGRGEAVFIAERAKDVASNILNSRSTLLGWGCFR